MNFDEVEHLRTRHAAWRLLTSSNVALVLSFLGRVFVDANDSNIPAQRLIDELDDELYALNDRLRGEDDEEPRFPRPAKQYLEDWASTDKGWLRRFYPPGSDEPHYDLTPAVEKALAWVDDLRARSFIGTESRLSTIFELLRQMVHGADENPAARLADLERRRAVIDAEIAQLKAGDVVLADEVTQRDRYQQFARTARELLSDFRQVEANFRDLDRDLREQIALWEGSKGELLDDLFTNRRGITDSDQGRSFRAFYDLLLSSEKQAELTDLLARLHAIDAISDLDPRLARVHYDWIDASERTQRTVRQLSEQLRRFLDDQVWLENRRVFDLLRSIEANAVTLREHGSVPVMTTRFPEMSRAAHTEDWDAYRRTVATAARSNAGEAIDLCLDGLLRKADAGDVVEYLHADIVRALHNSGRIASNGDEIGDTMARANIEIGRQFIDREASAKVDGQWTDSGACCGVFDKAGVDVVEPDLKLLDVAAVLCGQSGHDPCFASLPHQIGAADEKHRSADDRQAH